MCVCVVRFFGYTVFALFPASEGEATNVPASRWHVFLVVRLLGRSYSDAPPSTDSTTPVKYAASSDAKNVTTFATASGEAT